MPSYSRENPAELSRDQRRRELVAILAAGLLRLRQRRLRAGEPLAPTSQTAANSASRP